MDRKEIYIGPETMVAIRESIEWRRYPTIPSPPV